MSHQRVKVHRRSVFLDGASFTALSPRPDEVPALRVASGDDSVRITGGQDAATALGHLVWAMAFQDHARTVTVVETDAGAVVVVNTDAGSPTAEGFEALAAMLPLDAPSEGTVVLNTRGLGVALVDEPAFYAQQKRDGIGHIKHLHRLVKGIGDLLVLGAPAVVLRSWAVQLSTPDDGRPGWFEVTEAT